MDLKAFSEKFYWKITGGHLQPVLDTLVYLKRETRVWFEMAVNSRRPQSSGADEGDFAGYGDPEDEDLQRNMRLRQVPRFRLRAESTI